MTISYGTTGDDTFIIKADDVFVMGGSNGGGQDALKFDPPISPYSASTLDYVPYTVDLSGYAAGTSVIQGYFTGPNFTRGYNIGPADGSSVDHTILMDFGSLPTIIGTQGNDTISNVFPGMTITGGHGDDLILGGVTSWFNATWSVGDGNDTYVPGPSLLQLHLEGWGDDAWLYSDWDPAVSPTSGDWTVALGSAATADGPMTYLDFTSAHGGTVRVEWAGFNYPDLIVTAIGFYPGTLIATPDGPRAVETMAIGDMVLTAEGTAMPVRWMGRQTISTAFADKRRTLPVRISAGALGQNLPERDLLVSPRHALFLDGILVEAGALIGLPGIAQEAGVPAVFTYYHVELADHALVLAEGVPAETFVDNVSRENFDNWAEHEALYGHLPQIAELDIPRAQSYRQLPRAMKERLGALQAA